MCDRAETQVTKRNNHHVILCHSYIALLSLNPELETCFKYKIFVWWTSRLTTFQKTWTWDSSWNSIIHQIFLFISFCHTIEQKLPICQLLIGYIWFHIANCICRKYHLKNPGYPMTIIKFWALFLLFILGTVKLGSKTIYC